MSGLYSLNKDELVKIICTISADKDKEIKKVQSDYNHLIQQCYALSIGAIFQCDICKRFDVFDDCTAEIETCEACGLSFHYKCKSICCHCAICSDCNPAVNYTRPDLCDSCNKTEN